MDHSMTVTLRCRKLLVTKLDFVTNISKNDISQQDRFRSQVQLEERDDELCESSELSQRLLSFAGGTCI